MDRAGGCPGKGDKVGRVTKSVYIASSERQVSKSSIALGLIDMFARQVRSIGVYRPLVHSTESDPVTEALLSQKGVKGTFDESVGVSYTDYAADTNEAIDTIVAKYSALAETRDVVVVLGSDYEDLGTASELEINAVIAANLNSPVLYVAKALGRTVEQVARQTESAIEAYEAKHNTVIGIIVTHAEEADVEALRDAVRAVRDVAVSVLPPLFTV